MRYQLVLQFPGSTLADYDAMIALEDQIINALDSSAEVDGHDSSADECNLFVHTNHPAATFQQAQLGASRFVGDTASGLPPFGR